VPNRALGLSSDTKASGVWRVPRARTGPRAHRKNWCDAGRGPCMFTHHVCLEYTILRVLTVREISMIYQ
jgi:hypothetical protein